jgi:hypothetical protein
MMLRAGFLDELRGAATVADTLQLLERTERELTD